MALYVNTNIASLNAQRNLNSSTDALSTSLQRLSSGLRVNSAKDDAAGLAIATGMTSQIIVRFVKVFDELRGVLLSERA